MRDSSWRATMSSHCTPTKWATPFYSRPTNAIVQERPRSYCTLSTRPCQPQSPRGMNEFDQVVNRDFPNLQTTNPEVYNILESVQPYHDNWLGEFNKLNNNNKHQDLEEQSRTESRQVTVSSSGGSISWGQGVTFGRGVSVLGVPIDPETQMPIPNKRVKTEVNIWVDFKFKQNNESVLPFIEKSINSVEDIYKRLGQYI